MSNNNILLGVNIDHIATLRQARGTRYPDPIQAAILAEEAGADGITLHLREDRRHIQDRDVLMLRDIIQTRMNLEMAATDEMIVLAEKIKPAYCCLVPERREEITTEGGLDIASQIEKIHGVCDRLKNAGIKVSLFIDPDPKQIEASVACEAPCIEIHTGHYTEAKTEAAQQEELQRIIQATKLAIFAGLQVNAGHGLHYHNVQPVARIPDITEFNIGHSIIARAFFVGMKAAVSEMKDLLVKGRYFS